MGRSEMRVLLEWCERTVSTVPSQFDKAVPNALLLICDLHKKDGGPPLSQLPGLWERVVDSQWTIWGNGHSNPQRTRQGLLVGAFTFYVEFNGWPAGILCPGSQEGTFAAGTLANYDSFCAALQRAIDTAGQDATQGSTKPAGDVREQT